MEKIKRNLLILMILLSLSCKKEKHDYITFYNKSNKSIYISRSNSYPDTLLFCPIEGEILSGKIQNIGSCRDGWEEIFKEISVLQIFVINDSIAETQSCDTIRKHNMILKRYSLTYDNLQNMNWTITYP